MTFSEMGPDPKEGLCGNVRSAPHIIEPGTNQELRFLAVVKYQSPSLQGPLDLATYAAVAVHAGLQQYSASSQGIMCLLRSRLHPQALSFD